MPRAATVIFGMLLTFTGATGSPKHGVIIEANMDSTVVIIDGARVGVTPVMIDSLSPGTHAITLLDPDIAAWPGESIHDSIVVRLDTLLTYRFELQKRYFVTSDPGGADVLVRDSLYGKTPLLLPYIERAGLAMLRIRMHGYPEAHPVLAEDGILNARFREQWQPEKLAKFQQLAPEVNNTPLYLAGAATILSGTAAAYLKIKADNRYQEYIATNNASLLSDTNSIDRSAAVAIVLTQLSVVLFVYFLLKE